MTLRESREWPTIELILNKIVERFEKEEDQMMVIRRSEEKPWRTECLRRERVLIEGFFEGEGTAGVSVIQ